MWLEIDPFNRVEAYSLFDFGDSVHIAVMAMCLHTPVVFFSLLWQNTQHEQFEEGRACLDSQFEVGRHGRKSMRHPVTLCLQLEKEMNVGTQLTFFYSAPGIVLPTFRFLPASLKPMWKLTPRHIQSFVSWVFLNPAKMTKGKSIC